jgi:hypothetical protein
LGRCCAPAIAGKKIKEKAAAKSGARFKFKFT